MAKSRKLRGTVGEHNEGKERDREGERNRDREGIKAGEELKMKGGKSPRDSYPLVYSTYLSCIKLSTLCNTSASGCGWSG
jgi:hypothetical protein